MGDGLISEEVDVATLYDLTGSLGEGSYGAVWKGVNRETGNLVAVKIIPIDNDLDDLKKEIAILDKCSSPYVVNYYGSYQAEGHIWIIIELCEAGSVNDLMHICDYEFNEEEIKILCASVLLGLDYLHDNKMIHRDIKAGNILLTKSGQAKLADFGVSAQLTTMMSKRKTVIGTPFWMAPEVIQEANYDGKADLWSLGITMIELAEEEPPFSNIHPMRAIFMIPSKPPPKFKHPEKWSEEMNDFLKECLIKNPEQRKSAKELMEHPFVKDMCIQLEKDGGKSQVLKKIVDENLEKIEEFRINEMNRESIGDTMPRKDETSNTAVLLPGDNTMSKTFNNKDGTMASSGTMINNNGTRIMSNDSTMFSSFGDTITGNEPNFMSYFMTKGKTAKKNKQKLEEKEQDDDSQNNYLNAKIRLNAEEKERLQARIKLLDSQFKNDFKELKLQYDKRKIALISAASSSQN